MSAIDLLPIITAIIALIIAVVGHEIMHGWVAYRYGDDTAKNAGRLSINPITHIDPVGTILVPALMYFIPMLFGMGSGILFGWAKPVPINTQTVIKNGGYEAAMQVSLAGIAYNFLAAILFSVFLSALSQPTEADGLEYMFLFYLIMQLVLINVILAVFNLLPIPQFDGAHFLMYVSLKFRMHSLAQFLYKMEPYGMIIVVIVLITPLKDIVLIWPVRTILSLLLT